MVANASSYEWSVLLRDPDLAYVARIDYTQLDLTLRHNRVGGWSAVFPFDGDLTSNIAELMSPGYGLVFILNNEIVMSGPMVSFSETYGADGTHELQVGGTDDKGYLARRLGNPEPATAVAPYATESHDVRTGNAETIIKEYVDVNLGPGAVAARQVDGLVVAADTALGASRTERTRFAPLFDFVAGIADAAGLGVSLIQTGQGEITFDVYEPADKSASVRFAVTLSNIAGYEYSVDAPEATFVTVAGGGEGTARTFAEDDDDPAGWGRLEKFVDQRQTTDSGELAQAAVDALAESAQSVSYYGTVLQTGAHQFEPIATDLDAETYGLGDRVTAVINGVELTDTIREVQISHKAGDATSIAPLVGSQNPPDPEDRRLRELLDLALTLDRRVRNLERD